MVSTILDRLMHRRTMLEFEGTEPDLQILNPVAIPLIERRLQKTTTKSEELFALLALGNERCLAATYVLGQRVITRQAYALKSLSSLV